ncbi:MAG: peptidylprolyl isomerase [Planctomycetota bacterium]
MMRMHGTCVLGLAAVVSIAGCPVGSLYVEGPPQARVVTNMGAFVIELEPNAAPLTVANFRQYAEEGFYDGTIFHRVVSGFVIQGGGILPDLTAKPTRAPIPTEARNGLTNVRGSVAMARGDDPNSATAQFYVNLANNALLDATLTDAGYTVFGAVVEGMDVVDAIGTVPTQTVGSARDVPVTNVVIESIRIETAEVLSSEWETYLTGIEGNFQAFLRDMVVQVLTTALSG